MMRNYLKGTLGDQVNDLMAAAAFDFRRLLRKYERGFYYTSLELFSFYSGILTIDFWG
jgi:hypothetical protein